jgi:hypothetical protein
VVFGVDLSPLAQVLRRLAQLVDPDAALDALNDHRQAVRTYADLSQDEAARLALLTERVGEIATTVRLGHAPLEDALLDVAGAACEWLEAIRA